MKSRIVSVPAPVKGWVVNRAAAVGDPLAAEALENWLPTQRGIRVRGGLSRAAYIGANAVSSMFPYVSASAPAFFAASATSIFNITPLDPVNAATEVVTGQTAGYYSTQQIGTVGGEYLYAVNGANSARLYDGSTWTAITGASTPAISGVTTSTFSQVWLYRNRLFFVQKNTKTAWYLPTDSVGGTAQSVSMAGVFKRGGSLLFGATWSLDSGDGIDDKCVFVSTEGEVAIYEGSNPSLATDWRMVGRYDIGRPLGINASMQAGGDLLISTVDGIVPLSQVIEKDPAALSLAAVTRNIEPIWAFEAERNTSPIELLKWQGRGLGLVSLPDAPRMLTVNLQTGAWASQTGWEARCMGLFLDQAYIGRSDGRIMALDVSGLDDGKPFTARYCHSFRGLGSEAATKVAKQMRAAFYASASFTWKAAVSVENTVVFPPAPAAASLPVSSDYMVWNVSNWNEKMWWGPSVDEAESAHLSQWRGVIGMGNVMAPTIQITSGALSALNIELIRTDLAYEAGAAI